MSAWWAKEKKVNKKHIKDMCPFCGWRYFRWKHAYANNGVTSRHAFHVPRHFIKQPEEGSIGPPLMDEECPGTGLCGVSIGDVDRPLLMDQRERLDNKAGSV